MTLAFAAVLPTAQGAQKSIFQVTMRSPDAADITVEQIRTEEDAADFRQALDAFFGNSDGKLSSDEAEKIRQATEEDVQEKKLPMLTFDGTPATVLEASVTFDNVVGPFTSPEPVGVRHEIDVALQGNDTDVHRLVFSPPRDGVLALTLPEGWTVAETTNLTDAQVTEDGKLGGKVNATRPAVIVLSLEEESENESAIQDPWSMGPWSMGPRSVLAFIAPLAAIALLVGVVVQRRRGRRRFRW